MQYHIIADTVIPLSGEWVSGDFTPVYPRSSVLRPVCPSAENFISACRPDVLNIVLTAPSQLSGAYAMARDTLSNRVDTAILDSRTFGAGQLLLAYRASKLAQNDRFSVRVMKNVRETAARIECYFTAPNGHAMKLAGRRFGEVHIPFRFPIFRIGSEGEVHFHKNVYASSAHQALYRAVKPLLGKNKLVSVVHDRAPQSALFLSRLLFNDKIEVLQGESIPTDLPFGQSGFLSIAFEKDGCNYGI